MIDTMLMYWNRNARAGLALTQGLNRDEFADQPAEGMNHPAWVLSHLNAYTPAILGVLRGEVFDDPRDAAFGMLSSPLPDASVYDEPEALRSAFAAGHEDVAVALREQGDAALLRPVTLARWRDASPDTAAVLMNLLVWHETYHLGQLSAWRRVRGLASVDFLSLPKQP